jgi:ADP-ribose pyrophosphatase YjhB (NUDIX family)
MTVLHRVRVFVYASTPGAASYLLLHSNQGLEGLWRPVHGSILFNEQFDSAVRREVLEDTGLVASGNIIDLNLPLRQVLGDEEVIHWNFGFPVLDKQDELQLNDRWDGHDWIGFDGAFKRLELDDDRAAITRLHSLLFAA